MCNTYLVNQVREAANVLNTTVFLEQIKRKLYTRIPVLEASTRPKLHGKTVTKTVKQNEVL